MQAVFKKLCKFVPLKIKKMKHTLKDWIIVTRPWSFPASAMPVAATLFWLWAAGFEVNWLFGLWAVVNIILVHASGNIWSDYFDFKKGVDAKDTYGVVTLTSGQFAPKEVMMLSVAILVAAVAGGVGLVLLTGLPLLWIGMCGVALSLLYPALKYNAFGDLVIALCYAVLPMLGTTFIASGEIIPAVLWIAVPVGCITVAILHINNTRDIETDRRAGIKTLAMVSGRNASVLIYCFEMALPYVWTVGIVLAGIVPWTVLTVLLSAPLALGNARAVLCFKEKGIDAIARLDEKTAQLQLVFSTLLIIGLALSKLL